MKLCPRCNTQLDDSAAFCPNCGTQFVPDATTSQPTYIPADPYDHTAEFDPQEVAENKLFASLCYLTSILGIIVCLLVNRDSAYLKFHIRQSVKLLISMALLGLAAGLLAITLIVPIAAGVCVLILAVVSLICFFRTIGGKSIEAPIVRGLGFLK